MWLAGIIICLGWVFSLCLHEFSHAIVAYWGGDLAVKRKGYLTFNPLKYIDPGYSIILPLLFLLLGGLGLPGGAVYINNHKLRNRWWQSAVSAAGPAANILLALLLSILLQLIDSYAVYKPESMGVGMLFASSLAFLVYLQVFAAIFNLLPIPGLDGAGMIEPWLAKGWQAKILKFSQYSTLVILGLFWFVPAFSNAIFGVVTTFTDVLGVPNGLISIGSASLRTPINQIIIVSVIVAMAWGLNPSDRWQRKGQDLLSKGEYQKAIELFDRAIQAQPDCESAWSNKGYSLWYLERAEEAIDCFVKVLEIDADNDHVRLEMSRLLVSLDQYAEAIPHLERLINSDSTNMQAYYYLGLAWQKMLEYQQAQDVFDRALSTVADEPIILNAKGSLLHELQDYPAAIATYTKLVEAEPANASGLYNLGCCYALQGDEELALFYLEQAIAIEPVDLKSCAQTDLDWDLLRENEKFKSLIS